jgi:hypothetical protein
MLAAFEQRTRYSAARRAKRREPEPGLSVEREQALRLLAAGRKPGMN